LSSSTTTGVDWRKDLKMSIISSILTLVLGSLLPIFLKNDYLYYSAYVVLVYIVLSIAWNILGGYAGYLNFGVSAFYGVGAYTSAMLFLRFDVPMPFGTLAGGALAAILGVLVGYSTLRLKGIYFAMTSLAVAVMIQMFIVNTTELGGSRGLYIFTPKPPPPYYSYTEYLFVFMLVLALGVLIIARAVENSWLGFGLRSIKDDEFAAEASGVPTFKLKILAATLSGFFMGTAGGTFPFHITYLEPYSAFSLEITLNTIAMVLMGGVGRWYGALIGALILASIQQVISVSISSELNLLATGVFLLAFVLWAPNGLVGFITKRSIREGC